MKISKSREQEAYAIKFSAEDSGKSVGRAYLYILKNDLHEEPFGFLEDVFVEEEYRQKGIGRALVEASITEAENLGCYKLIATSRREKPELHEWYKKFGFKDHGLEFRIDF